MTPRLKVSATYPDLIGICLLRGLSEEEQRAFLDACTPRHYCEETTLLTQSEHTAGFYIVARGRVIISFLDVEGNLSVIHVAGPGEIMGDVECLSDMPCAATCTSLPDTTMLYAPVSLLLEYAQKPQVIRNIARILHGRLVRDNENRVVEQFQTVDARLLNYLCVLSTPDDPDIRISQAHLATLMGCSRQKVNRMLKDLAERGSVELGRGRIRILDRKSIGCELEQGDMTYEVGG